MQRILIVKTSSLGDVVHNLPVVTDMQRAYGPGHFTVDWVVEEAYADLPRMHAGVARVLPVALRRWRKDWLGDAARRERAAFRELLNQQSYDVVLDTQGLMKSALLARLARLNPDGLRVGASWNTVREPLASLLYHKRFPLDTELHAVERLRGLAAAALGYPVVGAPDFGLSVAHQPFDWLPHPAYAVLLFATARSEKRWPLDHWAVLGRRLAATNTITVLPWGSSNELDTARKLAEQIPDAIVAPALGLASLGALLGGARVVVGVDTGLTHYAAALGARVVTLFNATPRWQYAPYWSPLAVSIGDEGAQPGLAQVAGTLQGLGIL